MADPSYPPAKERSAALERVRQIARENLPRLLSAPGFREEPDPPTAEDLSQVVAPTLILVGERDDWDNRQIAAVLGSRLPYAGRRTLTDGGHLVNLERPEEFYRAVSDFLEQSYRPGEG